MERRKAYSSVVPLSCIIASLLLQPRASSCLVFLAAPSSIHPSLSSFLPSLACSAPEPARLQGKARGGHGTSPALLIPVSNFVPELATACTAAAAGLFVFLHLPPPACRHPSIQWQAALPCPSSHPAPHCSCRAAPCFGSHHSTAAVLPPLPLALALQHSLLHSLSASSLPPAPPVCGRCMAPSIWAATTRGRQGKGGREGEKQCRASGRGRSELC